MKILITGGAGFIGSTVADLFLLKGYEVVIVDDLSTGRVSNINPRSTFYRMDIRDPKLADVFDKERPDFVNHHAAQMDVRRSLDEPIYDADVNILGSINVIECAIRAKVKKFIYASSGGAVYGEPIYLPCDEHHLINPICQYGASKHTVEHYLYIGHVNHGLENTILRYANVYGPRQDPNGEAGVVATFISKMLSGGKVLINGDGEQQRDFVYVSDCAAANLSAIDAPTGIYNLGSGQGISINQIYQLLKKIIGYEAAATYGPAIKGETRIIYLDSRKAAKEINWQQTIGLEKGLQQTVEYCMANEIKK